ncbi:hypothetical protein PN36_25615 [Candidatus Thiomargarita nelsonii]|uniref:Legume lectin domain-containing protein n=1 Tax=Candidatus Thiomargarita nelsonii TaxID=1003181 RepID=A0A4E0QMH7_9GAMM|nr:hypothetical protein PN36_25615 [Candidatus Thiomargarita nelsonii]
MSMKTPIHGSTSFKPTKKWWQSTLVACLMTGALFVSPLTTTNAGKFTLKDFSDVSKLSLNGDAKTLQTQDGVVLRLTPSARIKAGSAFSTVKVSTAKFSSYFKFKISEPGGVRSGGADGFVFVVQPVSAHAGGEGGGMGYENIKKSVGVEFDTWNNENRNKNDSDENHVGINIKGAFNGPTMPVSPAFENGKIWHAWVDYDGTQMEVRVNTTGKRPSKPLLTRKLNISKIIGGTPEAFIGFTSATGGAFANHDIISWIFHDEFKPIGAASNVDVWIADSKRDAGVEPNKVSRRFWLSPGIWPRNKKDGINKYQNVELGLDNYVYVRAKNRGTLTASNTTVEVYRSIPSLGNRWPKGWKLVGKANIDTIEPNASQDVAIRWDKDEIPKPGHYCFYVRLLNDEDPMTSKERGDSLVNTRSNNNIAWRNFNVVDLLKNVTDEFEVTVHNTKDEEANIDLAFEEENNLLDNEGVGLVVDLGELYDRWDTAGAEGTNVKSMGGTKIKLLKTPAKLTGISMKPAESQNIKMRLEALNPMPGKGTVREYQFSTQEWVDGELVGGVDYALMTRAQDTDTDGDGIKDIDDEDDDNDSMPDVWEIQKGLNPLVPNEPIPESTPIKTQTAQPLVPNEPIPESTPIKTQTAPIPQNIKYTLDLASPVTEQFEFVVPNLAPEKAATVDIVFEEKNNILETGEVSVIIDLGPLFQPWQEAGAKGINVKHIEESTQVQVLKMPAKFMGIPMNANESQTILIKVEGTQPTTETRHVERTSTQITSRSIKYTLDLASPVTEQFEFVVSNSEKAANVDIVFEEKNNLLDKGEVSVIIDLGPLFQPWQEAGAKGLNVKHIEESTQVQVLKMPAKFMGIPMNANESQTILIKVEGTQPTTETSIRQVEEISESTQTTSISEVEEISESTQTTSISEVEEIPESTQTTSISEVEEISESTTTTSISEVEEEEISESTQTTSISEVEEEEISESTTTQSTSQHKINYILDFASHVTEQFEVAVSNSEDDANVDIVFEDKNNILNQEEVSIIIDLGTLFPRWQEAGAKGINVKRIEESTQVQVLKMPAKFMDLPMSANESQTILIKVDALKPQPTRTTETTIVEEERISETTTILHLHSIHYFMDFASQTTEPFEMVVSNSEDSANIDIVFEENNKYLNKEEVKVIVDLGPLFPRWQAAGAKGLNVGILDDGPQVQMLKTPAKFMGIPMNANESQTILIKADSLKPQPTRAAETTIRYVEEERISETTTILPRHSIHYFMDFASQTTEEPFEMEVSNSEQPANIDIVIKENHKRLNKGEMKVIVDLGPLFPRWQAAGAKGLNVGILDDGPQVQMLKTPAKFMGIPMNANESQTILIKAEPLKPQPTRTAETTIRHVEEERISETTTILPRHSIHYFMDFASQTTEPFEMVVSNAEGSANIDLVFEENNKRLNKEEVKVIIDLGPLFPRWQAAGAKGINVGTLDDGPQVQLLKMPAKIMGIKMTAAESQIIKVKVDSFNPMPREGTETDGDDGIKEVNDEAAPNLPREMDGDDGIVNEAPESTTNLPRHSIHYFLDMASQTNEPFEMVVSNSEEPANIYLVFDEKNKRLNKGEERIIVDLGPLFPRWQAAGAKGFNVGIIDEGPQVQLLKTPAKIMGIKMTATESQIIKVKVDSFNLMPREDSETDGDDGIKEVNDEAAPILPRDGDDGIVNEVPESTTNLPRHSIHYFLDMASQTNEPFEMVVSNSEEPANIYLVFDEKNKRLNKGEERIIVDLGPLFPRWQAAGAKGSNVGILDEGPQVQLLKTPAKIMGIKMTATESQIIKVKVDSFNPMPREGTETDGDDGIKDVNDEAAPNLPMDGDEGINDEEAPIPETTTNLPRHSIQYFLDIASQTTEPFEMVVSNSEEPAQIDLVFEENNKRLNKGEERIIVDLGPLFPRWQAAGAKGSNVGILDEGPQVQLLKTPAKIMGIKMTATESQIIKVKVNSFNPMPREGTETDGDDGIKDVNDEEAPREMEDIKDVNEAPIPETTPILPKDMDGDDGINEAPIPESTTNLPRHSIHYFLDIASQTTEPFEMVVSNSEEPAQIDLVFEENNKRLNKGEERIIVDLGPLFPRWQAAGAKGSNVGILDEGPQVQLLKTPAKFKGIPMSASESQTIQIRVDVIPEKETRREDSFSNTIRELAPRDGMPIDSEPQECIRLCAPPGGYYSY